MRTSRRSRARHGRAEEQRAALARRILGVQEKERAHLSRELHDELGQLLTGLRVEIDVFRCSERPDTVDYGSLYHLVDFAACRQLAGEFSERSHVDLSLRVDRHLESSRLSGEIGVTFYPGKVRSGCGGSAALGR